MSSRGAPVSGRPAHLISRDEGGGAFLKVEPKRYTLNTLEDICWPDSVEDFRYDR